MEAGSIFTGDMKYIYWRQEVYLLETVSIFTEDRKYIYWRH
jgi:hypothetical protein